jgi:DNA-binding transcriptional LysR family regulator
VTLAQMRYAVAVEDAQSFRLAAEHCHVSQAGLSMQLRTLEELLGVTLFDRSKKPLLVTPEGVPALAQMRAVLCETERLGQVVAEGDEPAGPFRLGVIPTLSPTVLPLFLGGFALAHSARRADLGGATHPGDHRTSARRRARRRPAGGAHARPRDRPRQRPRPPAAPGERRARRRDP